MNRRTLIQTIMATVLLPVGAIASLFKSDREKAADWIMAHGVSYNARYCYRGWQIYTWTGWKGNKAIIRVSGPEPPEVQPRPHEIRVHGYWPCRCCGKEFNDGEMVYLSQSRDLCHWQCERGDLPDELHGQWLAIIPAPSPKYAYASSRGVVGKFQPFDSFEISDHPCTELTSAAELEKERRNTLIRLLEWIDTHG